MAERTIIWDAFDYVFEADRRVIKPIRTYRNPIFLAREWADAMHAGDFRSRRAFAKAIGLSHTRVSQVLALLRLCPSAVKRLEALEDPLSAKAVTERMPRPIAMLPKREQESKLKNLLIVKR